MKCFESLNPEQKHAVEFFERNSMVFAGPGTGKTRIITRRVAYMFEAGKLPPAKNILAITFTNKAANEMKARVQEFTTVDKKRIRIGTFHNFCLWVLKSYGDKINMPRDFAFISPTQQQYLVKQLISKYDLMLKPRDFTNKISDIKNSSVDFSEFIAKTNTGLVGFHEATIEYQNRLYENKLIDYDDAILQTATLFKAHPKILYLYHNAFPYVLIDEMQDTNRMQLELIRLLGEGAKHVMAVADDDQSIYGWRGALPTVIQDFINLLAAEPIVLRHNYRSPQMILDLANKLIVNNDGRTEKTLVGRNNEPNDCTKGKRFDTWEEEAEWVTNKIKELHDTEGIEYRQMIILYRNRHSSLKIIDAKLIEKNIPFQHFGKNFSGKEILLSDFIVAAMKLVSDPSNEIILFSLLDMLSKRFEVDDEEALFEYYSKHLDEVSLASLSAMIPNDQIDKFIKALAQFCIDSQETRAFPKLYDDLFKELKVEMTLDKLDDGERIEEKRHLELLKQRVLKSTATSLSQLVAEIELPDDTPHAEARSNRVSVSTFHTAKGLEYKAVFIIALEDHIIPGYRNGIDPEKLQEERRGLYVAMTRSESKLFMTCASMRPKWKEYPEEVIPSRFFAELRKK
ncbi:ATP-dependent helicase [Paenibacillus sp. LHD-38]|uniref:ATP-dependent helicase n=1 Tax=Paenibacillus sp. LHD-38 TaxID=3072143 RepID=UPI00280C7443|nr:ATP-dependent helicase [Paenibacillus sp. LHD-38]MDQ8734207.1 ATP-dependent helicase [Paenibacillus sp. LHD-38]